MARISCKACQVLTCTILFGIPELYSINGFNDLVKKIIEAKVEENYKRFPRLFS